MAIRKLEIGSGKRPRRGFEHLDVRPGKGVDHVCDASKRLPFQDGTFDVVFACHVLEHLPWWDAGRILREWVRILKRGGELDVSVPDGIKICAAVLAAEYDGSITDDWRFKNPEGCPYRWANGLMFYGGKTGRFEDFHKALFTPRYLRRLMEDAGLVQLRVDPDSPIAHKEINLRMRGTKP